jgi:hypothetical protein
VYCINIFILSFRQLGPPTLFLTLSSSEYSWDDLLISILKTKKEMKDVKAMISNMKCDMICGYTKAAFLEKDEDFIKENIPAIIDSMSPSERNKFVNENIVLTTIEFQQRIQHIFKLLKTKGFIDNENKYRVEDSFIRIEHQVISIIIAHMYFKCIR